MLQCKLHFHIVRHVHAFPYRDKGIFLLSFTSHPVETCCFPRDKVLGGHISSEHNSKAPPVVQRPPVYAPPGAQASGDNLTYPVWPEHYRNLQQLRVLTMQ